MADFPTAAVARLGDYNGERYDAQTNPYGMAIGGHRVNFPPALNYTAVVVNYVGEVATEIAAFAQQTAADRVQTGQDRQAAANSAAAAATFDPAQFAKLVGANFSGPVSTTGLLKSNAGIVWGGNAAPTQDDWDAVVDGGVYLQAGLANTPDGSGGWFFVIVQRGDPGHVVQSATSLSSGEMYQRSRIGGVWQPWALVYTAAALIPNSAFTNMAGGTVKMRRAGATAGAPVDATLEQLAADLGFSSTLQSNGILRLPGGFILQWGLSANGTAAEYSQAFPIAFPIECLCGIASVSRGAGYPTNYLYSVSCDTFSAASMAFRKRRAVNGGVVESTADGFEIRWIAIGR